MLTRAVAAGYPADKLVAEPAFETLKSEPDFIALTGDSKK